MIDTIVNNLDIWVDAQGVKSRTRVKSIENISLEGIISLRKLILTFAVQGKLVIQDPNDEPASVSLKQIFQDKELAFANGKIKKQELFAKIIEEEKTFPLPHGWEWVRLGQLMEMYNGRAFKSTEWGENGLPIVRIQNLNDPSASFNYFDGNVEEQHIINTGTFLISWSGTPGTSFGAFIWDRGKALLNQHINKCEIFGNNSNIDFLKLSVNSCMDHLISMSQGGVGLKHVTKGTLNNLVFGFPPIAEQQRIVAKVNELMALCDKLEEEQFNNLKTNQALVKTLLETLTQAADANELQTAWIRISTYFDTLFCTDDSIDQLKQTILQLAVMGKLVKQDPNDEPASELIKKIWKEKVRLVEEGKIKKQSPLAKINEIEKPFELPKGWEWTRLGEIGIGSTGKTPSTNVLEYFGGDIPFIGPGQITSEGNITETDKTLTEEGIEYSTVADCGDILMVCIGGTIGKCAIVKHRTAFNQQINCMRPLFFNTHFLYDIMNATYFQQSILSKASGSATPIINRSKWEEILIPVPSLAEQVCIIQKIDELFTLCESLRNKIRRSQDSKFLLSKTIVEKGVQ